MYERLAHGLGNADDATEWVAQSVEARWGVTSPADLPRQRRAVALQKMSGVLLALEESGDDYAFALDSRERMVELVQRYFGVVVAGPPWRVTPYEDKPTHDEYVNASVDF